MSGSSVNSESGPRQRRLIDAAWQQVENTCSTQGVTPSSMNNRLLAALRRSDSPLPPDTFPGYRILHEIHRGGQGVVYKATQESTGRDVAIKVMRDGLFAGKREKARFEREVQILAQLKHPNIVTVHDSGSAGHAVYFVMDFIDGDNLDDYANEKLSTRRSRMRLFAKVCSAVNVAHLRGVIHRDLKPGNIRVDTQGEPHVLDFGLAKQTDADDDATEGPTMTMTGQFLGSMPWASPEQAEGRHADIDVRTDVYSLGVMLYQLLTGQFPYRVAGSVTEAANNIAHVEPTHPRAHDKAIDDELATIALKALRKEPEQRYQTAGNLGRDIERFLAGEPIEAKRDSMTYVLRKQLMKHKVAFGFATILAFTVIAGLIVSLSFWRQAVLAHKAEAEQARIAVANEALATKRATQAAHEAAKAQAVSGFLIDMLESASPDVGGNPDVTVRETIGTATARLDHGALADEPALEASIRSVIGRAYGALGDYEGSMENLKRAADLLASSTESNAEDRLSTAADIAAVRRAQGDLDGSEAIFRNTLKASQESLGEFHVTTARCYNGLADVARDRDRLDEAVALNRKAMAILREAGADKRELVAETLNDMSLALDRKGDADAALSAQEEALNIYREVLGPSHHATAVATSNLASLYAKKADYARAEELYHEAIATARKAVGDEHPTIASCLGALGRLYFRQQRYGEAKPLFEQSLEMRLELLGDEHPLIVNSLNDLAMVYYRLGELDRAVELYARALELFKKTRGPDHPSIAALMNNLAAVSRERGDFDMAASVLRDVLQIRRRNLGEEHPLVGESFNNLGQTLLDSGHPDEAEPLLRRGLQIRQTHYGGDHPYVAQSMDALAAALHAQGKLEEAESLCRSALGMYRRIEGDDSLNVAETLHNLAGIMANRGDYNEAESTARQAIAVATGKLPEDHWRIASMNANLGGYLIKLERYEEAEVLLLKAFPILEGYHGVEHPRTQRVIKHLKVLYNALDEPDKAAEWKALRQGTE